MAVGDIPSEARVIPSLKQAWTNIWPNFWWLLLFGFIAALASGTGGAGGGSRGGDYDTIAMGIDVGGGLIAVFLGMPLGMGVVKAHLAASRGQKPTWSDFGYAFGPRYWPTVGLGVLQLLIILGGLVLLILPGIYLAVRLSFTQPRFIEGNLGIKAALRASFDDTKGRWWSVFGLALMAIPLVIAGILALLVGIFVAVVLVSQMQVVYWRAIDVAPTEPARLAPVAPRRLPAASTKAPSKEPAPKGARNKPPTKSKKP